MVSRDAPPTPPVNGLARAAAVCSRAPTRCARAPSRVVPPSAAAGGVVEPRLRRRDSTASIYNGLSRAAAVCSRAPTRCARGAPSRGSPPRPATPRRPPIRWGGAVESRLRRRDSTAPIYNIISLAGTPRFHPGIRDFFPASRVSFCSFRIDLGYAGRHFNLQFPIVWAERGVPRAPNSGRWLAN